MSYNPILDLPKSRMYRDMTALGFYNLDGATLVRGEMRSYQYAIQVYLELIDSIAGGWWPLDCTLERLSQWEEVLGLPLRPRATEEQRRQTVLDLLSLGEQLRGPGGVERLLLAAGIWGRVEEDYPHRRLLVTVEEFGEEYDSIYQCMDRARQCSRSAAPTGPSGRPPPAPGPPLTPPTSPGSSGTGRRTYKKGVISPCPAAQRPAF